MASPGDIRVLVAMDLVLSFVFATAVVGGLAFLGVLAFAWDTVALAAGVLAFVTYAVVLR